MLFIAICQRFQRSFISEVALNLKKLFFKHLFLYSWLPCDLEIFVGGQSMNFQNTKLLLIVFIEIFFLIERKANADMKGDGIKRDGQLVTFLMQDKVEPTS